MGATASLDAISESACLIEGKGTDVPAGQGWAVTVSRGWGTTIPVEVADAHGCYLGVLQPMGEEDDPASWFRGAVVRTSPVSEGDGFWQKLMVSAIAVEREEIGVAGDLYFYRSVDRGLQDLVDTFWRLAGSGGGDPCIVMVGDRSYQIIITTVGDHPVD